MKPHVEGPDFERMQEARQILREAQEDRAEIKRLRAIINEMDTFGFSLLQAEVLHPDPTVNRRVAADYGSDRGN